MLEKGKYTMILINTLGLPIARKIHLESIEKEYDLFYKNIEKGIKVIYKEKGKRKLRGFKIEKDIVFIKDWIDIKGCFNTEDNTEFLACNDNLKDILLKNNIEDSQIMLMY